MYQQDIKLWRGQGAGVAGLGPKGEGAPQRRRGTPKAPSTPKQCSAARGAGGAAQPCLAGAFRGAVRAGQPRHAASLPKFPHRHISGAGSPHFPSPRHTPSGRRNPTPPPQNPRGGSGGDEAELVAPSQRTKPHHGAPNPLLSAEPPQRAPRSLPPTSLPTSLRRPPLRSAAAHARHRPLGPPLAERSRRLPRGAEAAPSPPRPARPGAGPGGRGEPGAVRAWPRVSAAGRGAPAAILGRVCGARAAPGAPRGPGAKRGGRGGAVVLGRGALGGAPRRALLARCPRLGWEKRGEISGIWGWEMRISRLGNAGCRVRGLPAARSPFGVKMHPKGKTPNPVFPRSGSPQPRCRGCTLCTPSPSCPILILTP